MLTSVRRLRQDVSDICEKSQKKELHYPRPIFIETRSLFLKRTLTRSGQGEAATVQERRDLGGRTRDRERKAFRQL